MHSLYAENLTNMAKVAYFFQSNLDEADLNTLCIYNEANKNLSEMEEYGYEREEAALAIHRILGGWRQFCRSHRRGCIQESIFKTIIAARINNPGMPDDVFARQLGVATIVAAALCCTFHIN